MKFRKIAIQNFRVLKDVEINFSTDPKKNVSIIIGNNGSGKTTLAQALQWCIFNKCSYKSNEIFSSAIFDAMEEGETAETVVYIEVEHFDTVYTFIRTAKFTKARGTIKELPCNPPFKCLVTEPGKAQQAVRASEVNEKLEQIIPEKLRKFIFFDGERIEQMSQSLMGESKTSEIEAAVKILLGLEEWNAAAFHLIGRGRQGYQSVATEYRHKYERLHSESDHELIEEKQSLEAAVEQLLDTIARKKDDIARLTAAQRRYAEQLKDSQTVRNDQLQREQFQRLINSETNLNKQRIESIFKEFSENLFALSGKVLCRNALEAVAKTEFQEDDIPFINNKTIDFLIQRGHCICGTPITEHSDVRRRLEKLKESIPPQSINSALHGFQKEINRLYSESNCDQSKQACTDLLTAVERSNEDIRDAEFQIKDINRRQMGSENMDAVIKNIEQSRANAEAEVIKLTEENAVHNEHINTKKKRIAELANKLQLVSANSKEAQKFHTNMEYAEALGYLFADRLEAKKSEINDRLDVELKRVFKDLLKNKDDIIPGLTKDFQFVYERKAGSHIGLSTAESFIAVLSCIAAIISLGRKLVEEDQSQAAVIEAVPLVMDAPLSAFDKEHIGTFGELIPNIAEQLILFIKDTDGEIVKDIMRDHVGISMRIINESSTVSHIEHTGV